MAGCLGAAGAACVVRIAVYCPCWPSRIAAAGAAIPRVRRSSSPSPSQLRRVARWQELFRSLTNECRVRLAQSHPSSAARFFALREARALSRAGQPAGTANIAFGGSPRRPPTRCVHQSSRADGHEVGSHAVGFRRPQLVGREWAHDFAPTRSVDTTGKNADANGFGVPVKRSTASRRIGAAIPHANLREGIPLRYTRARRQFGRIAGEDRVVWSFNWQAAHAGRQAHALHDYNVLARIVGGGNPRMQTQYRDECSHLPRLFPSATGNRAPIHRHPSVVQAAPKRGLKVSSARLRLAEVRCVTYALETPVQRVRRIAAYHGRFLKRQTDADVAAPRTRERL